MAFGLGVGEAAALKAQGGDEILTRAQLVLALASGWLGPVKLLSGRLGNGPHAASPRPGLPRRSGLAVTDLSGSFVTGVQLFHLRELGIRTFSRRADTYVCA